MIKFDMKDPFCCEALASVAQSVCSWIESNQISEISDLAVGILFKVDGTEEGGHMDMDFLPPGKAQSIKVDELFLATVTRTVRQKLDDALTKNGPFSSFMLTVDVNASLIGRGTSMIHTFMCSGSYWQWGLTSQ